MKKIVRILVLALAVALLDACLTERRESFDPDVTLTFQPAMYMQMDGEWMGDYPAGRPFGVWAWSLQADKEWKNDAELAEPFLENEEIAPSYDLYWAPFRPVLWPSRSKRLTIIAGSPFSKVAACTKEKGIEYRNVDMTLDQTDLLYTVPQTDLDKVSSGGNVTMPFSHALCQVAFKVKNIGTDSDGDKFNVLKIEIASALCKGDFRSLPEPTWTTGQETATFTFLDGNETTDTMAKQLGQSVLLIPQRMNTTVDVTYEYHTAQGTYITFTNSCPLQADLRAGRRYTYTLALGIGEVKFVSDVISH